MHCEVVIPHTQYATYTMFGKTGTSAHIFLFGSFCLKDCPFSQHLSSLELVLLLKQLLTNCLRLPRPRRALFGSLQPPVGSSQATLSTQTSSRKADGHYRGRRKVQNCHSSRYTLDHRTHGKWWPHAYHVHHDHLILIP